MKEYFSHDYHARDDEKIIKFIQREGYEGYGLYWSLVEMLYEADGFLTEDYEAIAYALRMDSERIETIKRVINNYELFKIQANKIMSCTILARLKLRKGISEKNRQSAVIRWNKQKKEDANALPTQCQRNAIKVKESKVKESKVKETIAPESGAEVIPDLLKDKQKHIQIIGLFARAKKIVFENKKTQSSFIKRNLRQAQELSGYQFGRIIGVMDFLDKTANYKWTMESVGKHIDEDLNNLMTRESRVVIV